jgi:hypothetical protein
MGKIELNRDRRTTMFAALGAFILSLIIGLVSGNPALVAFIRAIVSAVLFSAVVFGALYLLRRYIPELEEGANGEGAVSESDVANKVNYETSSEGKNLEYTDAVRGADVGDTISSEAGADLDEGALASPLGGNGGITSPMTVSGTPEISAMQHAGSGSGEDLQPLSEIPEVPSLNGLDGITLGEGEENENGEVEDLPSLDKLYEEHEQVSVPDIGSSDIGSKGTSKTVGDYIEVGNARIPFEPEVLAKAVKKVMKEDE